MKNVLLIAVVCILSVGTMSAKEKNDLLHSADPVTWLGLDFTRTRFIGPAAQYREMGEINTASFRDKYVPAWNFLFVNEQKKYDVAKYVHRESVNCALEVTAAPNKKIDDAVFSSNPGDLERLAESDITAILSRYDFQGKKGIGFLIIIEGMNKGKEAASGWITFVDMTTKKLLQTRRVVTSPGGFGFRNYWAKAFLEMLKKTDDH